MAFAQTSAPTETAFSTATTSHAVAMPATVNAGDLLFIAITAHNGSVTLDLTTPSGWTALYEVEIGNDTRRCAGYVKVADGTEGGTTVDVVTNVNATAAAQVYRVTSWDGTLAGVESATPSSGIDASPDPPSLTASWGSEDNLFLAVVHASDDDDTVTSAPTNYTGLSHVVSGGGMNNGATTGSARRELAAATDDPDTFSLSATEAWRAVTLVIRNEGSSMAATDAKPVAQKGVAFRVTFQIKDSSGRPVTGAASLDSEISKDGGASADCTNEATEIDNGWYYLDLTATEMNADTVAITVKSDQETTGIAIRPEEAGDIRVNTTQIEGSDATDQIRDAVLDDATRFSGADIAAILTDTGTTIPGLINGLNDPTAATIADAVWDEVITGAQHNVATSAAKFLREASETVAIRTGTAQAGASTTITLDASASSTNDIYVGERVSIIENTGVGQARLIVDYDGSTKVATVDRAWHTNPDNTSVFAITPADSDLRTIAADAQSVTDLKDFADAGYDPATNKVEGVKTADALTANNDKTGYSISGTITTLDALNDPTAAAVASAVVSQGLTEGYAAKGSAPTVQQALMMILQDMTEFAINGTTITVKKLDGSTTAMTHTLNDQQNPTSKTRSS